jgi:hypothetical protein
MSRWQVEDVERTAQPDLVYRNDEGVALAVLTIDEMMLTPSAELLAAPNAVTKGKAWEALCTLVAHGRVYRTKSGTILTDDDLRALADEAERGYCTALVSTEDFRARCFKPMPCPVHGGEDEG